MNLPEIVPVWSDTLEFTSSEVDCILALMLKILDGKCKMLRHEQRIIYALYNKVNNRSGEILGEEIRKTIDSAHKSRNKDLADRIHIYRLLAEQEIPRTTMKQFKKMLRCEGILPGKDEFPLPS